MAQTVSHKDPQWMEKVAEPAKTLALDTMDELSHGSGRALAVAYALFWGVAISLFAFLLYGANIFPPPEPTYFFMMIVVLCMYAPFSMSMDAASVDLVRQPAHRAERVAQRAPR